MNERDVEDPVVDLPDFWEWDDPSYDTAWNEPRRATAGAGQLCDNFLDAAHLPTVHLGTFGVPASHYRLHSARCRPFALTKGPSR